MSPERETYFCQVSARSGRFCRKVSRNLFLPSFCQVWEVFAEKSAPISAKFLPDLGGFCQKLGRNLFLPSFYQVWEVFAEMSPEREIYFCQVSASLGGFVEKLAETYFFQVSTRSGRFLPKSWHLFLPSFCQG